MVGIIKLALMKTVQNDGVEWPQAVKTVSYGYRRRAVAENVSPFLIMYGFPSRYLATESDPLLRDFADTKSRVIETTSIYSARAEKALSTARSVSEDTLRILAKSDVGDKV